MVLTEKKFLLSRYFSRLSRESLCTAVAMFRGHFNFISASPCMTGKVTVSA